MDFRGGLHVYYGSENPFILVKPRIDMLNLSMLLESSARNHPTKSAFVFMGTAYPYAQVNAAANMIANALTGLGVGAGDKVALSCPNLPYFPMVYFGILKAGAVVVPLSVLLKPDEIAYQLQDSDAKVYLCFEGTPELPMGQMGYAGFNQAGTCEHFFIITGKPDAPSPVEGTKTLGMLMHGKSPVFETVRCQENDTAVIIYTSGTTGRPKGAELTHSNLLLNALMCKDICAMRHDDVLLVVLPLFHIFAMTVLMLNGISQGATMVLIPRFDANMVLSAMQNHDVTVFAGVPTMYWGLINADLSGFDLKKLKTNLRLACSGGASLPVQVLKDFEEKFQVPILEGYGMSEGSPVVTFNHLSRPRKPGSVGTACWGIEVKLVDLEGNEVPQGEKGELLYRGHNVMKGYYKRPDATAETVQNGWLHSGDVAIKDDEGYYYIVDRTKDMIIRGGFNVYPREVEELMAQHPAVSMVAVIGVPSDVYGEDIKACVVLKEGASITETELMDWTKERIANYKYPRIIQFLSALPMNATGKILKRELRDV